MPPTFNITRRNTEGKQNVIFENKIFMFSSWLSSKQSNFCMQLTFNSTIDCNKKDG